MCVCVWKLVSFGDLKFLIDFPVVGFFYALVDWDSWIPILYFACNRVRASLFTGTGSKKEERVISQNYLIGH